MTARGVVPLPLGVPVFLFCYGVQLLAVLAVSAAADLSAVPEGFYVNAAALALACSVAVMLLHQLDGRKSLVQAGLTLKDAARGTGFAIGAYALFFPVYAFGIAQLNRQLVGEGRQALVEEILKDRELLTSVPFVAAVCVGVPCLEEFLFRGVLYPGLRARLPRWIAIVVSAVFFGLLHGTTALLPIASLGLLLGWIREKNASVLPLMAVHALHNSWTIIGIHALS